MSPWILATCTAWAFPSHDEPHRAGASAPDDAALVIGIEDYFALPDVPYAERDARAFRDLLIYSVGVPPDRVRTLGTEASREVISEAIAEAAAQVQGQGTLWIYFAGHGAASPSSGERLLLGVDTQASTTSFESRSIAISALKEAAAPAHRAVLVVDACYAGAGRDGGELLPGKRFAVPSHATAPAPAWIEWHAAQPNELSGPLDVARHGAFTWAVVGAMRGWADGQLDGAPDGVITLKEASLYVEEALRTVEVTEQRPSLRASDTSQALVAMDVARLEPRPDPGALKAEATAAPPPPAAAVPPAPDARPPGPVEWHRTHPCTPVAEPPQRRTKLTEWAQEPGVDPRATWECDQKGGYVGVSVNRFPPVGGKTARQLILDNLVAEVSRIPDGVPKIRVAPIPKRHRPEREVVIEDPDTWPPLEIETPRGTLQGWIAPIERRKLGKSFAQPTLVVEDDREPGAVWMCRVEYAIPQFDQMIEDCRFVLASALEDETIERGLVR